MATAHAPGWYLVRPDNVDGYLPFVRGFIEQALAFDPGKYAVEDIERLLSTGEQALWLALRDGIEGIITAELVQYPTGKLVCLLFLAAGRNARFWIGEPMKSIEAWARDSGASSIEFYGRKGWARVMGEGWNARSYMRKDL